MDAILTWLDDVPNLPLWLATGTVLVTGILVTVTSRLSRQARADARVDLGAPVFKSDPFMQGSSFERRKAPRRGGNPIAILVSDADAEVEPVRGWVLDRSVGGLGLELEEEGQVDVGTLLSVRPAEGSYVPWVKVEVRTCRKIGSAWRLGCKYLRSPVADIQMRFG
jgi:hypothetical protein